ncbi:MULTISPECIES: triphosphoribosyl-dephospho-CoA synthase CitG [Providencia]|uniref:Probable 2-(5''-triphosphoribosyl)-3'-dephosphocoenzyme-A synthase n=2 Tax=Providencia TaxID=586 RepID=A0AAI9D8Y2_PROST|nr:MULTISPECIES: triphosphoribosyl-dephospho-CoA synthase CitG [Providencia]ELR5041669.1 triphosphoribosyl-dephospho-CoA synthase CitG [Providencia stuartii]ELR5081309.1 triphosphoribosyl-dephospho-CoA synthase CitG [Providencia stuartii]ELR5111660.1 triphosphoribosyl-dephospho-CoA synthase CitG [Providencia stuartii]MDX4947220.1 triphosphoribosyl-dephospho-CoA synthase CitG [Providencia manganoxydans]QQO61109.1 triphosphoribosyl-dephospho-CoA synthase CitG [Providencia manganoxydans]
MRLSIIEHTSQLTLNNVQYYSQLAWQAMMAEVNLTPKPGLVDKYNTGAHKDMALTDFHLSANAIAQHFPAFLHAGAQYKELPLHQLLKMIRPIGIACEQSMFQATKGVNTHKGSIFSLGLILTAIGRLLALNKPVSAPAISVIVSHMCQGITAELKQVSVHPTAGQKLYQMFGLTGARGEAESGYQLVINLSLPYYLKQLIEGKPQELALLQTLLLLMANNDDTNVANRGGLQGLSWLKKQAQDLLNHGGLTKLADLSKIQQFDKACIINNLSPGGSADLLILTWFLARLPYSTGNLISSINNN